MKRTTSALTLFSALAACLAGGAIAAPAAIQLPPETAKLKPSAMPGYAIATQKCSICHSADYIQLQPAGMNVSQWTAEVTKMQHAYGAPLTEEDIKLVGEYLAVSYGSAKAMPVADAKAPAAPVAAAPAQSGAKDAMALLNANTCLSCHAADKKVVGPAYKDVAAKYKGDAQALAKVEASIRNGGSGKWGQIPMPPFAQLSDVDVKTMATWILAR